MRRKIEKIVPRYAWGPLILAVVVNMAVYEGVALFKDDLTFYSLELPIDRVLPFVATFIVFYLLAFVQWIINYVLIAYFINLAIVALNIVVYFRNMMLDKKCVDRANKAQKI